MPEWTDTLTDDTRPFLEGAKAPTSPSPGRDPNADKLNELLGIAGESYQEQRDLAGQLGGRVPPTDPDIDKKIGEARTDLNRQEQALSQKYQPAPLMPQKEFQQFSSVLLFLAALSGMKSDTPFNTALNSFASGLKGYMQGKLDQAESDFTTFKTNFEVGMKNREMISQRLEKLIADRNLPLDVKIQQAKILSGAAGQYIK